MARPREFDEEAVLDGAMNCFWARGFHATSVRDLADEMGITGASLYNAFGDKRALYHRTLDRYLELGVRERVERLSRLPPREAIRAFFEEIVVRSIGDRQRRGCMLVNAALEVGPQDIALRKLVAKEAQLLERFFHDCIEAGQGDGSIAAVEPAKDLAKTLLSLLFGLRVLARIRPQRDVLEGAVNGALGLLSRDVAMHPI